MDTFFAIMSFVFGLTFGSFLNVCIYRLPRDLSVVSPGSACPSCDHSIAFYDNVPIFGWLWLRGRCRNCNARISPRYILVELLTGLMFLAIYLHFGLTLLTLKYCVLAFLLIGLIFIDAEHKLLPDKFTIPGFFIGLAFSLVVPVNDMVTRLAPNFLGGAPDVAWRVLSLGDALLGAAVGAGFIYGIGEIYLRVRGVEGMGFGDVKLMAMIGAFLGLKLTLLVMFSASMMGALAGVSTIFAVFIKRTRRRLEKNREPFDVARKKAWQSAAAVMQHYQMPFGVFLGAMALLALFFGNSFLNWYLGSLA